MAGLVFLICAEGALLAQNVSPDQNRVRPGALRPSSPTTDGDHPGRRFRPLVGNLRVQYLLTRIEASPEALAAVQPDLDAFQARVDAFHAETAEERERLSKLATEARQKRDLNLSRQVSEGMAKLVMPEEYEKELMAKLETGLPEPERSRLAKARAHLASSPSGVLRPVDVLALAEQTGLSAEQKLALTAAENSFRERINAPGTQLNAQVTLVRGFTSEVRALLTPAQMEIFDAELNRVQAALDAASRAAAPRRAAAAPDEDGE